MKPIGLGPAVCAVCMVMVHSVTAAAQSKAEPDTIVAPAGLHGPSSVPGQIRRDEMVATTVMREYFDFKDRLTTSSGFSFGIDYTPALQSATASLGDQSAGSGVFRAFGNWSLAGRESPNTGSLVFQVYQGHRLATNLGMLDLGFEVGYAGLTAPFGTNDWALTNFYWSQKLFAGRLEFVAGLIDATDYLNVYAMIDPWNDFLNLEFSTGLTIPAPAQGLGAAVYGLVTENIYVLGGLTDANGDPTDPLGVFESFFGVSEYFSHIELGWIESSERSYTDNIHVTFWHAERRQAAGIPAGSGVSLSFNRLFGDHWMPFVRAGYAADGGALLEGSLQAGVGYYFPASTDQIGVGLGWGVPSEATLGEGLEDQYTVDLYYRLRLMKVLTVTPDIQLLINPALNPGNGLLAVFGLRGRMTI
jgi:porin